MLSAPCFAEEAKSTIDAADTAWMIAATGLVQAGEEQLVMLRSERWGDVERAVDRIDRRFGRGSAVPAALLDRGRDR